MPSLICIEIKSLQYDVLIFISIFMTCAPAKHFSPHGVEVRKWGVQVFRGITHPWAPQTRPRDSTCDTKRFDDGKLFEAWEGEQHFQKPNTGLDGLMCAKSIRASGTKCFTSPTCAGRWI